MRFEKSMAAAPLLSVFAALALAQNPAPPAPFVTHQMSPTVYWIEGGGGNSGVILGRKGVIVIDAKTTAAGGRELLDDIAKITPKPVTTVIETHSDGDHINGLAAFPKGIAIIAQENDKKEQEAAIAAGRGALIAEHPPTPDPIIHPEKNGSSEGWIATTKGMVALKGVRYLPGHGDVQTKAAIQKGLEDAEAKRARIKDLVAQGKSLDEIRVAVGDPPARGRIITFTEVVYRELTQKS